MDNFLSMCFLKLSYDELFDLYGIEISCENSSDYGRFLNIELVNNPLNIPTIDNIDDNYNRVLISSLYVRNTRTPIKTETEYKAIFKKLNNSQGGLCEIVGIDNLQVKTYFDVDYKDIYNKGFDSTIINNIIEDIQKIYNNDVYIDIIINFINNFIFIE
jgi:hypothetical protein